MEFILKILVTAAVLLLASKQLKGIFIRDYKAAIIVSLLILTVGFFIGWIFTLAFNILTLGTLWILGLGIITRTVAYAFVIEIVDKLRKDFNTQGLLSSFWLSIALAISWSIIDVLL